ncbi:MAG: restriction endonuclease subunit S, partial [Tissierellales bacterium]
MGKMIKVRLNELGEIITGNTPSKKNKEYYDSNDIPFVKPDDLIDYKITSLKSSKEFISNAAESKARILKKGSVLFTCIGIIGKVGIIDCDKAAFNQQINAIVPNDKINNRYLAYCLMYNKNWIKEIANAPVVPIISKSQFEGIEILIDPNLETQHKIVQVLDKAQSLIDKRKEQIKQCDELIQSLFYEMFGSPVLNTKSFQKQELKNIAEIILGQSPSSRSYNTEGIGIPFFQGSAEFGDKYPTVVKWTTEPKKIAQKNDILISVRAPVGDVNIANIDCCIGRGLAAIRPSNKIIYRDYLFYYLKATSQIIFESKKAGSTFDSITGKNLGSTPILIPPLEQQKEFV